MEKKLNDTCRHIHTAVVSAWSHVSRVKEIAYATSKQTGKNVVSAKSNRALL
ncbi:MAG: hypothetical protein M1540_00535 [Candidatus Bathyarchaeota archaeon]|nr:hypothetical protein [Candidatus Bathyarchaeota archaeon]